MTRPEILPAGLPQAFPPETPFFLPPTNVTIPPTLTVPPIGIPPVNIPGTPPPTQDDDDNDDNDGDDTDPPSPTDPPVDPPVDVPEPGTLAIVLAGAMVALLMLRRRKQSL